MRDCRLTLSDCVLVELLPAGSSQRAVDEAAQRLESARRDNIPYDALSADMQVLTSLADAVGARANRLRWALELTVEVARDAELPPDAPLAGVLRAVARHLPLQMLDEIASRSVLQGLIETYPHGTAEEPPLLAPDGPRVAYWRAWLAMRKGRPA
jgi:hypothetical protein